MGDRVDEALALFGNNCNCAQAVVVPFAEGYGLSRAQAMRVAGAFGGGLRCGEVCGAATGGAMVVGLKHGQETPEDTASKANCNAKTIEFMNAFKAHSGALRCRDLLGHDNTTPEGQAEIRQLGLHKSVCAPLVRAAAELLEELGY